MVFNSLVFLPFFAMVLAVYFSPVSWKAKKVFLIGASYVFYGAWNPPFALLLVLSTVMDWLLAAWIARTGGTAKRRALITMSLAVNLGLLAFFKYGTFLLDNFVAMLGAMGITYVPAAPSIILPVGISFYTFQTLSYTLDVYTGREKPWRSFLDFALYVSFFPQLVAGPIVRSGDFLPQCHEPRRVSGGQIGWGLTLLLVGLFQKIVVADALLAPAADKVFQPGLHSDWLSAWLGVMAFAGQIYSDFSGYSTCAIGVAACMGFAFNRNFKCPYAAVGFSDFWRRWHISLSTWLRDYLYIPLGGNRRGPIRMNMNLMTTMLLGGLWHGASWTFVVWGGLHGALLVVERWVRKLVAWLRIPVAAPALMIGVVATYAAVCVTWVFFRATTFGSAFDLVRSMFGFASSTAVPTLNVQESVIVAAVTLTMLLLHWGFRERSFQDLANRTPWPVRGMALATLGLLLITMGGDDRAFIYFQF